MGLLTGVWTWLTRRVLADTRLGTANGYVVVDAEAADADDKRALADALDLPAYQSPVDALRSLEDAPDRIYAWEVASEARARSLLDALESHDVQEMDALHLVLTDKEELAELTHDEIRTYVDAGVEA
ncbi:hypothetical protein HRTV-28_gp7 [Halorubrum tailed virus 28]|uniref:Uncharacterized protein n=1 Tax=Halorubrum tailed virus 28 TaxID=2878009 RepID=A0AAE8XZ97_9CAUD|nr:hypothetical protein M1M39_gp08 [Halorubrum tailed virus 28]UBF23445.1 hypothetical protein HRTV-28_gp7 [Halorubrum tailed virus 28]